MDVRIWALLAVALFIGGFASFTGYFSKLDAAQHELAKAKAELESLEKEKAESETSAEITRIESEKVQQLAAVYDDLEKQKQPLVNAVLALEGQKEATRKVFREAVEGVRSQSVGIAWPDVPFRNGQILRQVRIQKVTESEVTLAHGEGVAKLRAEELPQELKMRFRVGMEPFLEPPPSTPAPSVATAPGTPGKGSAIPPDTKESSITAAPQALVDRLQQDVINSDFKIKSTIASMSQWKDRCYALRDQATAARANGRPTYTFNSQAAEAEKQANALESQILQLRLENTKLRESLGKAKKDLLRAQAEARVQASRDRLKSQN